MAAAALLQSRRGGSATQLVCHDRYGYLGTSDFGRRACTLCYTYLFVSQSPQYVAVLPDHIYLMPMTGIVGTSNATGHENEMTVNGSYTDSATRQNDQVCN